MEHSTCYTPHCPRRESCTLWHNALTALEEDAPLLSLTSPRLIDRVGGYDHCPHYREHRLRRYARGIVWKYDDLTLAQWDRIRTELTAHFGYSTLVRLRCGYEAITPEEQAAIARIFADTAPDVAPQYIVYEEHYTKPPRVEARAARKLLYPD